LSWVETAKRAAIIRALEEIRAAHVIGIGSGTTLELLVGELAKTVKSRGLELKLVATSHQIESAIIRAGLTAVDPNDVPEIDLALDGADQVESQTLNLIKGGGAALTREKIIDTAAKKLVVVVDERKLTQTLGKGQVVPVEVIPFAHRLVMSRLAELGGKPRLRCGKDASPVGTDNGNFVVDVDFGPIRDALALDREMRSIPGLLETGLFLGLTDRVYVGLEDGTVQVLQARQLAHWPPETA
jgi:ribose 5-phosphate isomerase A